MTYCLYTLIHVQMDSIFYVHTHAYTIICTCTDTQRNMSKFHIVNKYIPLLVHVTSICTPVDHHHHYNLVPLL